MITRRRRLVIVAVLLLFVSAVLIAVAVFPRQGAPSQTGASLDVDAPLYVVVQTGSRPAGELPQGNVWRWAPRDGVWKVVLAGIVSAFLRVSPDGRWIAYCWDGSLWVCDREGRERRRLARLTNVPWNLTWATSSRRIVWCERQRATDVYTNWLVTLDGSSVKRFPLPPTDLVSDWSPDGKWLLCASSHGASSQLWLRSLDNRAAQQLTSRNGLFLEPQFSADGTEILFATAIHREQSIYAFDRQQGSEPRLYGPTTDSLRFCAPPDGEYVAIVALVLNPSTPIQHRQQLLVLHRTDKRTTPLDTPDGIWVGPISWR